MIERFKCNACGARAWVLRSATGRFQLAHESPTCAAFVARPAWLLVVERRVKRGELDEVMIVNPSEAHRDERAMEEA